MASWEDNNLQQAESAGKGKQPAIDHHYVCSLNRRQQQQQQQQVL
jgi:hypothetical protein